MEKEVIATDRAPAAIGPYSLGIKTGNLVFVSGTVGWDADGNVAGDGSVKAQTRQAFENIKSVLEAAGVAVEVQAMDWSTRNNRPTQLGYNSCWVPVSRFGTMDTPEPVWCWK